MSNTEDAPYGVLRPWEGRIKRKLSADNSWFLYVTLSFLLSSFALHHHGCFSEVSKQTNFLQTWRCPTTAGSHNNPFHTTSSSRQPATLDPKNSWVGTQEFFGPILNSDDLLPVSVFRIFAIHFFERPQIFFYRLDRFGISIAKSRKYSIIWIFP